MRKSLIVPLLLAGLGTVSCGTAFTAAAAVVNGQRISMDTVEDEIDVKIKNAQGGVAPDEPAARIQAARVLIDGFIRRAIVRQEAERLGIRITDAKVDEQIQQLVAQFGGQEGLDARVAQEGWSNAEFRERVRDEGVFQELRTKLAPVTAEQVRAEYDRDPNAFRQVRMSTILIKTEGRTPAKALAAARAARDRIRSGQSFASVAKAVSEDEQTKAGGGSLGGFVLVPALEVADPGLGRAVSRARLRALTGPVRTAAGYHVFMVTAKRIQPFNQAQEQIKAQLENQLGGEAFDKLLQSSLKKAKIVVNPRYGDWDAEAGRVVDHEFFKPPTVDSNQPPDEGLFSPPAVAPPAVPGQ